MADENIRPTTKKEARALGSKFYCTGKPCKRGHNSPRRVKGGSCVECGNEHRKRWRAENPERTNELHREWRKKNPEKEQESQKKSRKKHYYKCRESILENNKKKYYENIDLSRKIAREASRKFREDNKDTYTKNVKAWRKRNPEKHRKLEREIYFRWSRRNPEAAKAINMANRIRRTTATGSHTAEDIKDIYKMQNGKCAYCKAEVGSSYHIDHIQPLSLGGSNNRDNIQITCPTCNMKKSYKDPIDYAQSLGLLL